MKEKSFIFDLGIASIPALLGFFLNLYYTKRSLNKEKSTRKIERLIELIEATEKKSYAYFSKPGNCQDAKSLGIEINADVGNIGRRLQSLRNLLQKTNLAKSQMISYRRALTGDDFHSPTRQAILISSHRFTQIRTATDELATTLEGLL